VSLSCIKAIIYLWSNVLPKCMKMENKFCQFIKSWSLNPLTLSPYSINPQAVGRAAGPPSECQTERGHTGHHHTRYCPPTPDPHHWALRHRQDVHPGTGCQTHPPPGPQQVGACFVFIVFGFKIYWIIFDLCSNLAWKFARPIWFNLVVVWCGSLIITVGLMYILQECSSKQIY